MNYKKISKKHESRIARHLSKIGESAKVQKASGAMFNKKSDVISELFRIEAKTKSKLSKSITLKKEYFEKIHKEALETGKIPVLVFSFGDGQDFYVLEEHDFSILVQEFKNQGAGNNERKS